MDDIDRLAAYFTDFQPVLVLTGAGCSTRSGIPDYRDRNGLWKQAPPVQYRDFIENEAARKRYWARSMNGWPRIASAMPNDAHKALARLEAEGLLQSVITQNVDNLHQKAGSRNILDLHGNLGSVRCLQCGYTIDRDQLQYELLDRNRHYQYEGSMIGPDGDAQIKASDFSAYEVPECPACCGILKPEVVFFGEAVPAERTTFCKEAIGKAQCLLVIGSSLMLFSGYRLCRIAREQHKPVISINLGRTRADAELTLKIEADCGEAMNALLSMLISPAK